MTIKQLITPLLTGDSVTEKRAELKAYFRNTWATYESLFALINQDDAFYLRPEPLRHPLIFYYGHTAVFYINKLVLGQFIPERVNPKLEAICAVGVDEMSWDDLNSEHYEWPTVEQVRAYRKQVAALVEQLIDTMTLTLPITQDSLAWIILMGCEHERIHIETSSVIMRMLDLRYLHQDPQWQPCTQTQSAPENQLLAVSGKIQRLGKPSTDTTYGWDNEYGELEVEVADFSASKYLVSNEEFLTFVEAGGYQQPQWWTEEGQQWLSYTQAQMPRFWRKTAQGYVQRNLLNEIPLPLDWPVEVNYLEAKAFCHWLAAKSQQHIRLPTEAEWYCLRDLITGDAPQWSAMPGNMNLALYASSCPVNQFEHAGFFDIVGNVWQWTESPIDGFNGFAVHPLYDDFSTPTFDGRHNLIKGGSWISTGNEILKSSRYAFRRHFFQHAGFRYVAGKSAEVPITPVNTYETNPDVCLQLGAHYHDTLLGQKNGFYQLAEKVRHWQQKLQVPTTKLLDLGCRVGRVSFELAPHFDWVDAVDFSARYIQHGVKAQQGDPIRYIMTVEGDIVDYIETTLSALQLAPQSNILFSQGDPCNLKAIFTDYDVVIAQQIIERSYQPKLFLQLIADRIKTGGLLILVSDYQVDPNVTDKEHWIGGLKVNGENMTVFDGISQQLSPKFTLVGQDEVTQLTQLNKHNYQVKQLQLSIWQKR
jgi:5-histidylcysteine sulfoxide synthase/putative 4-mercaptohistidine N1-methyltranferase